MLIPQYTENDFASSSSTSVKNLPINQRKTQPADNLVDKFIPFRLFTNWATPTTTEQKRGNSILSNQYNVKPPSLLTMGIHKMFLQRKSKASLHMEQITMYCILHIIPHFLVKIFSQSNSKILYQKMAHQFMLNTVLHYKIGMHLMTGIPK